MPLEDTDIGGSGRVFPNTIWSSILKAKNKDSADCQRKIEELVYSYWKPVYVYVKLAWRKSSEDAKDLTQSFFTHFLEKDCLQHVSPEKGKFRTYVKRVLENFLKDERKLAMAQKRGGEKLRINFDQKEIDISLEAEKGDPSEIFEKEWARAVMSRSINALRDELKGAGKGKYFEVFQIINFESDTANPVTHTEIAKRVGIKETDVSNYLRHAKKLLRKITKEEIGKYVYDYSEVEEELKYLSSIQ